MSTIREDFFTAKAKGSLWDVAVSIKRGNPLPLDADSIFESYAALEAYAADVLAYPGQVVAVVNEDSTGIYYLDQNLAIKPVGVIPAGDELSVDMDDNDVISLHNFGKVFYKYVAENGDVAAHYEKVDVSDVNPWTAGLEPRVVTEDGKLVLGWYEPNPTTIDGVNDQVTAVQGTVSDLVDSVGAPSTENSEATGLYKEVEDVQEDVKELTDAVGSSEDALSDDVQTLWAHVNDHTGRLEELEAIDHSLFATKEELTAEADRADKAEKANAAAIKVIADDYLKAADIANMATDAEVEAAVKAEADRAKGVEESLQNQINLIMNNPETENVIDSINEFMTYIEEHGDIAEGFRTDIGANSTAITNEITRATGAESALSGRLDVLEAIDHDAYIAADTALKTELETEINKKANADTVTTDIAAAKQAAIDAAAADATTKANAAQAAAIADADAKLALKANANDVASTYATKEFVGSIPTGYTETNVIAYVNKKAEEVLTQATGGSSESAASVKAQLDTYKTENAPKFEKLEGIETGAQVNVIESVVAHTEAKITATTDGKVVTINDAALREAIATAKTQADKGVADAATADAKAVVNAEEIGKHETRLGVLEEAKADHLDRITKLEAHDQTHAAEFNALSETVTSHGTTIADWTVSKANTADLNTAISRIAQNEVDIATKANASALNNYYTKTEVGTIADGKTLVEMITDAQAAATYDDTAIKALINAESERADAEEKRLAGLIATNVTNIAENAAEIARVNGVLVAALENDQEGLDSIKELASWIEAHGKDAAEMVTNITSNTNAINAINNAETGILAVAKKYTDDKIGAIPVATAEILGLVKFDDTTIKMNESNQLYVSKVSTDILEQGTNVLILNGGSAKD